MLLTLLSYLLYSKSLTFRSDNRITLIILFYCLLSCYTTFYITYLEKGVGLYGGLFNITAITQTFQIFIFLICILILSISSFYPREIYTNPSVSILDNILKITKQYVSIINKTSDSSPKPHAFDSTALESHLPITLIGVGGAILSILKLFGHIVQTKDYNFLIILYIIIIVLTLIYLLIDPFISIIKNKYNNFFYTTLMIIIIVIGKMFLLKGIEVSCSYTDRIYLVLFSAAMVAIANIFDNKFNLRSLIYRIIASLAIVTLSFYVIDNGIISSLMGTRTLPREVILLNETGLSLTDFGESLINYIALISPYLITYDTAVNIPTGQPYKIQTFAQRPYINRSIWDELVRFYGWETTIPSTPPPPPPAILPAPVPPATVPPATVPPAIVPPAAPPATVLTTFLYDFPIFGQNLTKDVVASRFMSIILRRTYDNHVLMPDNNSVSVKASETLRQPGAIVWFKAFLDHNRTNPYVSQDFRDRCQTNYSWARSDKIVITPEFIAHTKTWVYFKR